MFASLIAAIERRPLPAWLLGSASTLLSWLQLNKGELDFWFTLLTGFFGTVTGAITFGMMIYRGAKFARRTWFPAVAARE